MRTRLKYYSNLIHELHIYLGLFISPFVIIFGISVLALNHTRFLVKIAFT